jgi:hypothetical protein
LFPAISSYPKPRPRRDLLSLRSPPVLSSRGRTDAKNQRGGILLRAGFLRGSFSGNSKGSGRGFDFTSRGGGQRTRYDSRPRIAPEFQDCARPAPARRSIPNRGKQDLHRGCHASAPKAGVLERPSARLNSRRVAHTCR